MQTSENINELATALSKAQSRITGALKDSDNPFFKSKYADLAACWDAGRDALTSNGLAVIQSASADDVGVIVTSMLTHSSGQWVRDSLRLTPKDKSPQGIGSCITYGRRYLFAAMAGIAQVDDDGNAASGKTGVHTPQSDLSVIKEDPRIAEYAKRFRDAMDADANEPIIAAAVFDIHTELTKLKDENKLELYQAAAAELPANYRNAIKTYITMHKANK